MKIKGKRILKNGVTAGYVKQKDGSWRFRFLKGAGRQEKKGRRIGNRPPKKKFYGPKIKNGNIGRKILYDNGGFAKWLELFKDNSGNRTVTFMGEKLGLFGLGSTSTVYGKNNKKEAEAGQEAEKVKEVDNLVIKRIDIHARYQLNRYTSAKDKFYNEVNFLKKNMEKLKLPFVPKMYLAWFDTRKNIGYMVLRKYDNFLFNIKTHTTQDQKKNFLINISTKLEILNVNGYTHGDVQLSNIKLHEYNNSNRSTEIMLIDFGQVGNTSQENMDIQAEQFNNLGESIGYIFHNNNNNNNNI